MEKRYLQRESRSKFHCTDQSCNRPYEPTLILEEFNLLKKDQLNSWVYCWTFNGFIILFLAFVFNNEVKQSEQSLFCQTKRWENSIAGVKRSFSAFLGFFHLLLSSWVRHRQFLCFYRVEVEALFGDYSLRRQLHPFSVLSLPLLDMLRNLSYVEQVNKTDFFTVELDFQS